MKEKSLTKVTFNRPTKTQYVLEILKSFFSSFTFKYYLNSIAYKHVNYIIGRKKAEIGKNTKIHPTVVFRQGERIKIGSNCLLNHNNVLQAGKKIGRIIIGDYVQTGPNVMMFAFNHSIDDIDTPSILQDYYDGDIVIEDDVWIGAGSIILAGVTIKKGSVIAAGSIVNKDIDAYSIYGGVPAKKIKSRL
ncbi:MAG: acyltransferase [Bacteroidales bacterium]|nr:acyltransferase [Bacteroidales bacterium]